MIQDKSFNKIMKFTALFFVVACVCDILRAEDLKIEHPAFGIGEHKLLEYNEGTPFDQQEPQVVSRLSKNGFTYVAVSNWLELKINRYPDSDVDQTENIINFNHRLDLGSGSERYLRIVDVHATNNEISFLVANQIAYRFFKVTNQNINIPDGWFLAEIEGINSANWKLKQYHHESLLFGEMRSVWGHVVDVDSIKLISINQIEVKKRGSDQAEIINVTDTVMESNGTSLEWIKICNPMFGTEDWMIHLFSPEVSPTVADVKERVDYYKGGKDFILNLLNQFTDQNAANQIRARILEAYPPE